MLEIFFRNRKSTVCLQEDVDLQKNKGKKAVILKFVPCLNIYSCFLKWMIKKSQILMKNAERENVSVASVKKIFKKK